LDLSVIIINYKSPELILDCLQSVYAETISTSFEVIIIDNHSEDNSKERILSQYPEISWIQLDYNAGFSRANNAGIQQAKGELVLLLNSDTVILDRAIDKVVRHIRQDNSAAAASVQLLNADKSSQNAGNYFVVGGLNMVLTLPVLNTAAKRLGEFMRIRKPGIAASAEPVHTVDWISGAFMLVKKSAIEKAGLMDEDFFLFSEEIEWCSRLKKAGNIKVYTDAKVIHLEGGTTKKLQEKDTGAYYEYWTPKGRQLMLSHLVRIRKQYSVFWMLLNYLIYLTEIPVLVFASLFSAKYSYYDVKGYILNVCSVFRYFVPAIRRQPFFYKVM
jgi:GT2 family glycosyltransferase